MHHHFIVGQFNRDKPNPKTAAEHLIAPNSDERRLPRFSRHSDIDLVGHRLAIDGLMEKRQREARLKLNDYGLTPVRHPLGHSHQIRRANLRQ